MRPLLGKTAWGLMVLALASCSSSSTGDASGGLDPNKPIIVFAAGSAKLAGIGANLVDAANAKAKAGGRCGITTLPGNCYTIDCRDNLPGPVQGVLAGDVTVTPGTLDQVIMSADPTTGWYTSVLKIGPEWPAGTPVTFSASGGKDIPAFTFSGKMPALPVFQSPMFPATGTLTVDRSQPFDFTWTSGSASGFFAAFLQSKNGDTSIPNAFVELYCVFDGSQGKGEFVSSALSKLDADTGATSTSFIILNLDFGGTTLTDGHNMVQGGYPLQIALESGVGGSVTMK